MQHRGYTAYLMTCCDAAAAAGTEAAAGDAGVGWSVCEETSSPSSGCAIVAWSNGKADNTLA